LKEIQLLSQSDRVLRTCNIWWLVQHAAISTLGMSRGLFSICRWV